MSERKLEIDAPPGEPYFRTRRIVDAPAHLVFEAFTKPEYVMRWLGPAHLTMLSFESDLRPGGSWRMLYRRNEGEGEELGFHGEYREIEPPTRLVRTFIFDPMPDQGAVETLRLEERDGRTVIHTETVHKTVQGRDAHLCGADGMREAMVQLDALLAELQR